jgi:hypothetical protein
MRSLAGLAITCSVWTIGVTTGAVAQTPALALKGADARLMDAAFSRDLGAKDPISDLLDRQAIRDAGWRTQQVAHASVGGAAIDTFRISVGEAAWAPNGLPLDLSHNNSDEAYEVRLTRDWPAAVSVGGDRYDLALTPHAGFGVSNVGNSAEAGATLTLGQKGDRIAAGLDSLGVRDGSVFGGQGRWYVFAAASGRAMGFNMLKDGANGLNRSWSQDSSSTLVGDAQLGVGWRKGPMQTSFGYIHREVKGDHMIWGQETKADSMVAFSLSIKPRR